jgi:hypothetical protein
MINSNMQMSSGKDQENIANIYQQILNEDMTAGGVYGGDIAGHAGIENADWLARDDARNVYGLGVTTRKGRLKTVKRERKRRKIKKN